MSLEIKNIKTLNDLETYIEGCLNDYKYGLSTQEETKNNIAKLISHLIKTQNEKKI